MQRITLAHARKTANSTNEKERFQARLRIQERLENTSLMGWFLALATLIAMKILAGPYLKLAAILTIIAAAMLLIKHRQYSNLLKRERMNPNN